MTLCREHHFASDTRCKYCSMQARYYNEGMATLKSWSKKEIESDKHHYEIAVEMLMCKVHSHDEDSLLKLYNMER